MGRKRKYTEADAGQLQRERAAAHEQKIGRAARDIGAGFTLDKINWDRRLRAKNDPQFFADTYMPAVFYLPPSDDHLRIAAKGKRIFQTAGKMALAMPRAQGKTAWCRCLIAWGTLYGFKRFPFFIGSTLPKARQTLNAIKITFYATRFLLHDFPEIIYPIVRMENRHHLAAGQLFDGQQTHAEWGGETIQFPCTPLTQERADILVAHDPDSLIRKRDGEYFENNGFRFSIAAGTIIRTSGIDGAIRGDADMHPILLTQPRPDLVLLDDIQKDARADSPAACAKLSALIDGAIEGLSMPDEPISCLMPCTVTREGDVSDTFLDRDKRPEWNGERCSMVTQWPDGISDYEIDPDTMAGGLWLAYQEKYRESFRLHGDFRLATDFYAANREAMDVGFEVSWPARFDADEKFGGLRQLSAIQKAMNLRLANAHAFAAEYQNRPKIQGVITMLVKPGVLAERVAPTERGEIPGYTNHLTAFVDVQNEVMVWMILATATDYTGVIVDWGTWPAVSSRYWQRHQFDNWSTLTRAFFQAYPEQRKQAQKTEAGKLRAPFEAKIFYGVTETCRMLMARTFARPGMSGSMMSIEKIGVDYGWGRSEDSVKSAVDNMADPRVIYTRGFAMPPSNKQFEEYILTKGWLFEHQRHVGISESKWLWRPGPDGRYYLAMDVNRLKSFAFSRLTCPLGTPGAIALFKGTPEDHAMLSDQIAGSEYPDMMTARGREKEMWYPRDGKPDNDALDCLVGNLALASWSGARIADGATAVAAMPPRKTMAEMWAEKKGGGR